MSNEKAALDKSALGYTGVVLVLVLYSYLHNLNLIPYSLEFISSNALFLKLENANKYYFIFKLLFSFIVAASFLFIPSGRVQKKYKIEDKPKYFKYYIYTLLLFHIPIIFFHELEIIPFLLFLILHIKYSIIYWSIRATTIKDDATIFGINKGPHDELSISVPTSEGELVVSSPNTGIRINGGPGSGKTVLIYHKFKSFVLKGYCGVVYDFEGDPTEYSKNNSENPLSLSRCILHFIEQSYKTIDDTGLATYTLFSDNKTRKIKTTKLIGNNQRYKNRIIKTELDRIGIDVKEVALDSWSITVDDKGIIHIYQKGFRKLESYLIKQSNSNHKEYFYKAKPVKFALINFTDPTRSYRINPFNKKYIPSLIQLRSAVDMFIKAVDLELVKKSDFWAKTGMAYTQAIAMRLYKDYPKYLTIPHLIVFLCSDYKRVLPWIEEDEDATLQAAPIMVPFKAEAEGQLSGSITTAQSSISALLNAHLFWVLSPTENDELDLNITNKNNPTFLCIGNSPQIKEVISPMISTILNTVMNNMNTLGKRKSLFSCDEFPTITMNPDQIANLPATARKKKVVVLLATQSDKQEEDRYGKDKALIIRDNLNNQFQGRTPSTETAENWSKKLGETKRKSTSISTQNEGGGSFSESLQKELVMPARDISGQPKGHFIGQLSNGKPPFFSVQIDMFKDALPEYIPEFNPLIKGKEGAAAKPYIDALVQQNYLRIKDEVNKILTGQIKPLNQF